ncbi:MAG: hypothetical protein E8D46_17885 [Nitrospira sp.]|jgi:hypothetical protein|nr:hypothetical protein [Nitrospiraceae bacterium]NOS82859.1 hypothetical protein [Nitrospira sp.]TKB71238.1 MAG: hypothetical protein E8D46_17885 [Nitrospira sp.]
MAPPRQFELIIHRDGTVSHLHTDGLRLTKLGPHHIRRASLVEPSRDSRRWEVRLPQSKQLIATATTRGRALTRERARLLRDILPTKPSAHSRL